MRDQAHVNGVESFWASLKRGYHGTFHHPSAEHLGRYVAEFAGRHSRRCMDTEQMMATTIRDMIRKQPVRAGDWFSGNESAFEQSCRYVDSRRRKSAEQIQFSGGGAWRGAVTDGKNWQKPNRDNQLRPASGPLSQHPKKRPTLSYLPLAKHTNPQIRQRRSEAQKLAHLLSQRYNPVY